MLTIFGTNVKPQPISLNLNQQSLAPEKQKQFSKRQILRLSLQVGEFVIVNGISWLNPVSGICIGLCFLLWHFGQTLKQEEVETNQE